MLDEKQYIYLVLKYLLILIKRKKYSVEKAGNAAFIK